MNHNVEILDLSNNDITFVDNNCFNVSILLNKHTRIKMG